jgi:hypothetical protein
MLPQQEQGRRNTPNSTISTKSTVFEGQYRGGFGEEFGVFFNLGFEEGQGQQPIGVIQCMNSVAVLLYHKCCELVCNTVMVLSQLAKWQRQEPCNRHVTG